MPRYRDKLTGEIITIPDTPQAIPIGMQDPAQDLKREVVQSNINNTQANTRRTTASIKTDQEKLALARQAAANASEAARHARQVADQTRNSRMGTLNSLANQIGRVEDLYRKGPGATKGVMGALDYLPTPGNSQFDSAAAGLAEIGLNAFRTPGVGSQSDKELKAFIEANRPSASDYDDAIKQKIWNLRNRLSEAYKTHGVNYPASPPREAPRKSSSGGWKIERAD